MCWFSAWPLAARTGTWVSSWPLSPASYGHRGCLWHLVQLEMDGTEAPKSWPVCLQVLHSWTDTYQNQTTHSKAVREGMTAQGWVRKGMRLRGALSVLGVSIIILPNPSFHWRCNHLSGASQSKAANVNNWLLEAHLFNFFLLYVHSWLKPRLAASLCSCWACPWPPVIKSRHCPWKVLLAGWCWELISDLVVTGGSLPAAHVEATWIQHLSSGLVLLCRCGTVKEKWEELVVAALIQLLIMLLWWC